MLRPLINAFWNEDVWLPPNTTWADITPGPDKAVIYTDHRHMFFPIPLAVVLIIIRYLMERYIYAPFGLYLGIKASKPKRPPPNAKLEAAYKASPIAKQQLCALAKQLDISERQIERWWRQRRAQDKPSKLVKFCEEAWKFSFGGCSFIFGLYILWDKDWLWDIDQCFVGYPHQGLTSDVWWYYMVSTTYYWSVTITQFWDVRRKDFWPMFVHHIVAIAMLSISWVCNLHRIGTLGLLLHDSTVIFLEATKAAKYANYQKVCNALLAIFTVLWIIANLGIFPFYIIWSMLFRAPMLFPTFVAFNILTSLLYLLLALYIMWTWMILQIVYRTIKAGKMEGDIRSSSSDVSDSSHQTNHSTPNRLNNKK